MFPTRALIYLLPIFPLLACGDNRAPATAPDASSGSDAGDNGLDEHGCKILTLGAPTMHLDATNRITGLHYLVTPNVGDARPDYLLVELYDSTSPGLEPLTPGTFDLTASPDNDLFTCQHCVWLNVDTYTDNVATLQPYPLTHDLYYATEGSMTLDTVQDPLGSVFAGSTSHVELHRAALTSDSHTMIDPDGDCVSFSGVSFDTSPTPGAPCGSAEDCGDPTQLVCDPMTNTCGPPTCNFDSPCVDPGQTCVIQFPNQFYGACYTPCNPSLPSTGCGPKQTCQQYGIHADNGYCKDRGTAELGEACQVEDNTTSCVDDAVCSMIGMTCTNACSFFDDVTGCSSGTLCSLFGVCEPPQAGVAVGVGEACPTGASEATGCAPDGQAFRGICHNDDPFDLDVPRTCEKACLDGDQCPADQFCALRFESGLGVCRPLPVCGDGVRGEINEACDDGNTVSGDGCSGDCQMPEYGVLCASAPELPLGGSLAGNTSTGVDGFFSSCQFGTAHGQLFQVTPPGPGQLTLHVASPTVHTISLRTACADATSELACNQSFFGDTAVVIQVKDTDPAPVTAVVTAYTVLDEGPFTVSAEFIPATCGDGVVIGNEACDDGNTAAGDGCSADCLAFEYDVICAQAPVLSTSAPNTGDTTTSPNRFASSCADPTEGSGNEDLYTFVAPDTGTLHLSLEDTFLSSLAVFDGCGTPADHSELACESENTPRTVDVPLVAGQQISVLVEGVSPLWVGTYTLTATFMPAPN
jgi:cysteine-rich repeat protein